MRLTLARLGAVLSVILMLTTSSFAQLTWTSGDNNRWTTDPFNNWDDGGAVTWTNGEIAIFNVGGNKTVIVVGQVVSTPNIQFLDDGFTLNPLAPGDGFALTGGGVIEVAAGDLATINSDVAGLVGLNKTGNGTLVLTAGNAYNGGTTVTAGILAINGAGALGNGGVTMAGGTLDLNVFLTEDENFTVTNNSLIRSGANVTLTGTVAINSNIELGVQSLNLGEAIVFSNNFTGDVLTNLRVNSIGNGIVLLSGDNSGFSGITIIENGVLRLDSLTAASNPAGGVYQLDGGTLDINATLTLANNINLTNPSTINADETFTAAGSVNLNGNALTLSSTAPNYITRLFGQVTGAGGLIVAANSAAVLANAANDFTGGITINNNAVLSVQDDAGALDGSGQITMEDGSALNIAVAGSYDNPIDINSGTATLNSDFAATIAGPISAGAMETMQRSGTGQLTFTGNSNAFQGTANFNAGTTIINNGVTFGNNAVVNNNANSTLQLNAASNVNGSITNNGSLGGIGTITGSVANNGTLTPGLSIGEMVIDTNFDHNPGATLQIEIDPTAAGYPGSAASNDRLDVNGTATLDDGSIISVVNLSPNTPPTDGDTLNVIDAAGGVTANVDQLIYQKTALPNYLAVSGQITGNIFQLIFNNISFTGFAQTPNEIQVAQGLDALLESNPAVGSEAEQLLNQIAGFNNAQAKEALYNLSPERYSILERMHRRVTQQTAFVTHNYLFSRRMGVPQGINAQTTMGTMFASTSTDPMLMAQVMDEEQRQRITREGYTPGSKFNVWAQGFYLNSSLDNQRDTQTGYTAHTGGGQIGLDYRFTDNFLAGLAFTFTGSDVNYDGAGGNAEVFGYRIGPYLSWEPVERLYIDASMTYGLSTIDSERTVVVGGAASTAEADYLGHDLNIYLGVEYDLSPKAQWYIAPLAGINYTYFYQEGFTESGAGGANLVLDEQNTHALDLRLGGRFAWFGEVAEDFSLVPEVLIAYRHEFLADENDAIEARFVGAAGGFAIPRASEDRSGVEVGAGLNFLIKDNWAIHANYNGVFYPDSVNHMASVGLTYSF